MVDGYEISEESKHAQQVVRNREIWLGAMLSLARVKYPGCEITHQQDYEKRTDTILVNGKIFKEYKW